MSSLSSEFLLTKIIATLGPSTNNSKTILKLIEKGVRIFRVNFSHGSFEDYKNLLVNIRDAEKESGEHIAVLGDLAGPKIRIGKVVNEGVRLSEGQEIKFIKNNVLAGSQGFEFVFSSTFPDFIDEVKIGEQVLLDDGKVRLVCVNRKGEGQDAYLVCQVVDGGLLTSSKGINLPESDLSVPCMTEKDFECAAFAVQNDFDYLALSFVRSGEDVRILKNELIRLGARPKEDIVTKGDLGFTRANATLDNYIPIICKIEKPQAIEHLADIINETDGIMVARGDLGVEMDLAEVAVLQKKIIRMCQDHARPVVVATQMLESMISSPVPTRAEVSDVANAIMDGADAVMLSGETAVGKYPVETVDMMERIAVKTNGYIKANNLKTGSKINHAFMNRTAAIANAVGNIVEDLSPKFLVVWTNLGGSAVNLSQQRTAVPIIAFNDDYRTLRKLSFLYSIKPMHMELPESGSSFIRDVDRIILENRWASPGDPIVIVSPDPINRQGITNRIVVHYLGQATSD